MACTVYYMNIKYQTIVLLTFAKCIITYKKIIHVSHVNCHFVSCIGRCGYTAKCQEPDMQYH